MGEELFHLPADGYNVAVAPERASSMPVPTFVPRIAAGSKIGSTVSSRTIIGVTSTISVSFRDEIQLTGFLLKGNHLARSHGFIIPTAGVALSKALCLKGLRTIYLAFTLAPRLPVQQRKYALTVF